MVDEHYGVDQLAKQKEDFARATKEVPLGSSNKTQSNAIHSADRWICRHCPKTEQLTYRYASNRLPGRRCRFKGHNSLSNAILYRRYPDSDNFGEQLIVAIMTMAGCRGFKYCTSLLQTTVLAQAQITLALVGL